MPNSTPFQDDAILAFACKWEPYGGADASEIFVCFGLSAKEYRARLHRALTQSVAIEVGTPVYRRLLRYAAA